MESLQTIIFTGVSGGGKTTALKAVEDLGFFCVDNLPLPLLNDFIETMKREPEVERAALVVDARLRKYIESYALAYMSLTSSGHILEVVYLDASDEVLIRRFSQTRRRHPLGGDDLRSGLQEERELLEPLRAHATTCVDTSDLTPHSLKRLIQDRYSHVGSQLVVHLISFGFRYGVPSHADLVLDVRFLPNPFFVDEMRHLSGTNSRVAAYVIETDEAQEFLNHTEEMLRFLLPLYEREGKVYLTLAIGCTGGQHRSVAMVEELGKKLEQSRPFTIWHRDIKR